MEALGAAFRFHSHILSLICPIPMAILSVAIGLSKTRYMLTKVFIALTCSPLFVSGNRNYGIRNRVQKPMQRMDDFEPLAFEKDEHRFSIDDMNCSFFEQPLNHFDLPRGRSGTYKQRYCIFDQFIRDKTKAPIFFYTGNESPLEQYINQTGLMWESAPEFGAQIVFVEHRYEGKSLPNATISNCMAYSSSVQALADYANFIERYIFIDANDFTSIRRRPVIAFGGSYGGMLSAWLRNRYPNVVVGAIAASAPTLGFPRNDPTKIDAAYRVIDHGLQQSYPPMNPPRNDNHCALNLKATWPLVRALASRPEGRQLLTSAFRLCKPLVEESTDALIGWAQSPWFDMAEGSFPYPSSYIPFALLHKRVSLPPWPVQAACWTKSDLHQDWGVIVTGNVTNVRYKLDFGESGMSVHVDWDDVRVNSWPDEERKLLELSGLLSSVRDAVSVWFNITKDQTCYDLNAAPNVESTPATQSTYLSNSRRTQRTTPEDQCRKAMSYGSWGALCCNEEMNLIITEASGLGYDSMWPPTHPRGTCTHADVVRTEDENPQVLYCSDPDGIFG